MSFSLNRTEDMDSRPQDLLLPGEASPSVRTYSDHESTAASDIEMDSLAPALGNCDQNSNQHGRDTTSIMGVSAPFTTSTLSTTSSHTRPIGSHAIASDRPSTYSRLVLDTWICEYAAMVFSFVSVIAISVTVGYYDGKRIPDLPSGITLNAMISVLSTAARSALIFVVSSSIGQLKWCWLIRSGNRLHDMQLMDEGSRGPLGAIGMLASRTGGSLANLGAIITLCMIAFSPFLQQLVDYPTHDVEQPELKAIAPRNSNFTLLQSNEDNQLMRNLVNSRLVFSSAVLSQSPQCPTARCSWEKFKSVGWCSKCSVVTGTAYSLQDCNAKKYLHKASWKKPFCNLIFKDSETQSWSPPYLMDLTNSTNSSNEDTQKADALSHVTAALWTAPQVSKFVADDGATVQYPLMVFKHASFSRNEEVCQNLHDSDSNAIHVDYVNECFLTLCEIEYIANTTAGITSLTPISTDYGKSFTPTNVSWNSPSSADDLLCWRPDASLEDSMLNSSDEGLTLLNESERIFCPIQNYPKSIRPHVPMSLTSTWYFNSTHASSDIAKFPDFSQPSELPSDVSGTQWSSGNFTSSLEGVAAALTSYGLITGSSAVLGRVFLPQSQVRVRWLWIELPVILELACLVLFLSTIMYSRRAGIPIWKSSILAICYHRIEELHDCTGVSLLSDMHKASSVTCVQFCKSDEDSGFLLRRVPGEVQMRTKQDED